VCLGSDYPFPLGDLEIGKFIQESDLPNDQIEDIFANAALSWMDLDSTFYR
jgi:aminocarboxymuconate-semialdehyde decarboxylase